MIGLAPAGARRYRCRGRRRAFARFIRRDPVGVVLVVAPWNYPYLTAVNAVVPALIAGNAVLLKHAQQTPLCAEAASRPARGARPAACPGRDLLQALHMTPRGQRPASSAASIEDRSRRLHRLGRRRRGDREQRRPDASSASASSSAARTRPMCAPTPTSTTRSRISSTAPSSMRASPAAASSASMCTQAVYDRFVEGAVALTRRYVLGDPTRGRDDARAAGAHRRGRFRPRPDGRGGEAGRARPDRRERVSQRSRGRHALSRAPDPGRRRSCACA